MSAILVAAILAPLLGAALVLALPAPDRRRRPRTRPSESTAAEATDPDEDEPDGRSRRRRSRRSRRGGGAASSGGGVDQGVTAEPPDPEAVEQAAARARVVVRGTALAAAGLWAAVTLAGYVVAGPFTASGPVGPAGVGAALLLAAVRHPVRRRSALAGATALGLLTGGLALAAGDASLLVAAAALVAGAAVIVVTGRRSDGPTFGLLGLVGMAVVAAALAGLAGAESASALLTAPGTGGVLLPSRPPGQATAALAAAGALVAILAGALRPRRLEALLLPVGLAVGVPAIAALGPAGDGVALVLGAGAAAAAGAWAAQPSVGARPLVAALALLALAAAAGDTAVPAGLPSGGVPAAWLLAASAVVTAVTLTPLAAVSAVPGAAALTAVLVDDPRPVRMALVALLVITTTLAAVAVVSGRADDAGGEAHPFGAGEDDTGPVGAGLLALALGAWLVAAPGTWAWAGPPGLERWTESLALALAGGLIAAVGAAATGRIAIPGLPRLVAADPQPPGGARERVWGLAAGTVPEAGPSTPGKRRSGESR